MVWYDKLKTQLEYISQRAQIRKEESQKENRINQLRELLNPLRQQLDYLAAQRCNAPRYEFLNPK